MATWSARTVTTTRYEWIVPAEEPWGAALADVESATAVAATRYREAHGLADMTPIPGDALRYHVTDDEIVISFTTGRPASA
ncbi:hypothetical protein ACFQ67_00260 [Streptomyces sp. NPDC056488]|uniref:hypothetical protein n=1 Tax=Streptomyces sp. NPDC056488 TaxID=3345836 RepID=UPI00369D04F0